MICPRDIFLNPLEVSESHEKVRDGPLGCRAEAEAEAEAKSRHGLKNLTRTNETH